MSEIVVFNGLVFEGRIVGNKIDLKCVRSTNNITHWLDKRKIILSPTAMGIKVSDVTYREVHGTSANENAVTLKCSQARCSNIVMDNVNIITSTPGKEAKAICQNVDGKSESAVPIVPCLSKSQLII